MTMRSPEGKQIVSRVTPDTDIDTLVDQVAAQVEEMTGIVLEDEEAGLNNILKSSVPFPKFSRDEDGDLYKVWEGKVSVWTGEDWQPSELDPFELSLVAKRISDREGFKVLTRDRSTSTRAREAKPFSTTVEVAKSVTDDYENLVFGWANVAFTPDGRQVEDLQGHLIDVDELESTAYNFVVKSYGTGEQHTSESFGELVESMVFTKEKMDLMGLPAGSLPEASWWVGFHVPPETHEKVREGKLKMFSIEGSAKLQELGD